MHSLVQKSRQPQMTDATAGRKGKLPMDHIEWLPHVIKKTGMLFFW
jgi:hypothetical protein